MVQFDPLLRDRDLLLVSHGAERDARMIRQYWPDAVEVDNGRAADQWYLGPRDQRVADRNGRRHFVFMPGIPIPPSAADH